MPGLEIYSGCCQWRPCWPSVLLLWSPQLPPWPAPWLHKCQAYHHAVPYKSIRWDGEQFTKATCSLTCHMPTLSMPLLKVACLNVRWGLPSVPLPCLRLGTRSRQLFDGTARDPQDGRPYLGSGDQLLPDPRLRPGTPPQLCFCCPWPY